MSRMKIFFAFLCMLAAIHVALGAAGTKLAVQTTPSGCTAGMVCSVQPVVSIQDSSSVVDTTSTATVYIRITAPAATTAILSGRTAVAAVAGVATFTDLSIDLAGTYTLTAFSSGLTQVSVASLIVQSGTNRLLFFTAPSGFTGGSAFTVQPVVRIQDPSGTLVLSSTTVSIGIKAGTGAVGAKLSGSTSITTTTGSAVFSGLSLDKAAGTYVLIATASNTLSAETTVFTVAVGAASQLSFQTSPPSSVAGGATMAPAVTVAAVDAGGNIVTSFSSGITLSLYNPSSTSGATLTGGSSVTPSAGVSTFSALSINKAGTYRLVASATGPAAATSSAITVTVGSATKLGFTVSPSGTLREGTYFSPTIQVAAQDAGGNTVTSVNTGSVVISISGGTGAASGNSIVLSSGLASFPNFAISIAGSYTLTAALLGYTSATVSGVVVSTGSGTALGWSSQPAASYGSKSTFSVVVNVLNANSNIYTRSTDTVYLSIAAGTGTAGATLLGTNVVAAVNGVATFTGLSIDLAGSGYKLSATASNMASSLSNAFAITAGAAVALKFSTDASNVLAAASMTVVVDLVDSSGNIVTTSTDPVTITLLPSSGTDGAVLSGGSSTPPSSGRVTFSAIKVDLVGSSYVLKATSLASLTTTSSPFNVQVAAASTLALTIASTASTNIVMSSQPTVKVTDAGGNAVSGIFVTLSSGSGGFVSKTATSDASGIATFSGVVFTTTGTKTMSVTAAGATAGSGSVLVSAAVGTITMTSSTSAVRRGATVSNMYTVSVDVAPTTSVTLTITAPDGFSSVSPTSLTFTNSNYATPQSVSVTALPGTYTAQTYSASITHATSGDTQYTSPTWVGATAGAFTYTVIDSNSPYVKLSNNLVISEGLTATYTIVLSALPTSNVVVTPTVGPKLTLVSASTYTFTTANWFTPQTVTVRATADLVFSGYEYNSSVSHTAASADSSYDVNALFSPSDSKVIVSVLDDDVPGIIINGFPVLKENTAATYTIALRSSPSADVNVTVTPAASLLVYGGSAYSVIFTPANWNTPQIISLQINVIASSSQLYTTLNVVHSASSTDPYYTGAAAIWQPSSTLVANIDNLCQLGSYSYNGVCSTCPPGASCLDISSFPVACPSGYYSAAGDPVCRPCPAGSSCTNSTVSVCVSPNYSLGLATSCTMAPAGTAWVSASTAPVQCPLGYTSNAGSTSCTICPVGSYCPDPALPSSTCSAGYYSLAGATVCTPCPPGSYCATTSSTPTPCAAGSYSLGQATACTQCIAGTACPKTDAAVILACPAGYYSAAGAVACTLCPAGSRCPTPASTPTVCTAGNYALAGSTSCTACPAGWACSNVDGSANTPCLAGSYSVGAAPTCTSCPAGYACPLKDAATQIACASGTYATGGQATCTGCPAGYACSSTSSSTMSLCAVNTYSVGNQSTCTTCPSGFECHSTYTAAMSACAPGYYRAAGSAFTTCQRCAPGYYCPDPTSGTPIGCPAGTYSGNGQQTCTACPAGYFCPAISSAPTRCNTGTFSTGNAASCISCSPGYQCTAGSISATPISDICPKGTYCAAAGVQTVCPAGTYGILAGATSQAQGCATCIAGYWCPAGAQDYLLNPCPMGHYCPTGAATPTQCPAGYYLDQVMANTSTTCKQCPPGRYCPAGSTDPNSICPSGYYCPARTQAGTDNPCPAGTYTGAVVGLTDSSGCQPCPIGYYCPVASVNPTSCPPGRFGNAMNRTALANCASCLAGYACPFSAMVRGDQVPCQPGYYCPVGTINPTDNPCQPGYYSNATNLATATGITGCQPCEARYSCDWGTGGPFTRPQLCAAGYYCPIGTATPKQFACPAGTWSNRTNLEGANECQPCPAGKYCLVASVGPTGDCAQGHYCPLNSTLPDNFPCAAGTYTPLTNATNQTECTACPTGYYCPSASIYPNQCPAGTYANVTKTQSPGPASAFPACITCPAGYYCASATIQPTPCGKGTYSSAGATSCTVCDVGHYCNANATSTSEMTNNRCQAGTWCQGGNSRVPTLLNEACPTGAYCPEACITPTACPPGTYNPLTGQGALDVACITCPAGHYCVGGHASPDGVCSSGYFCPAGSNTSVTTPCPKGTYRNITSGTQMSDCGDCPSGYYCPNNATVVPTDCPSGSFCIVGSSSPQPCGAGTYANMTNLKGSDWCTSCPPGMYCDSAGAAAPSGICDAGYYCKLGATTPAPSGFDVTGGPCPAGGYCPSGSSYAQACPAGFFSNVTGAHNIASCVPCTPGKYCQGSSNPYESGPCDPGYYCNGSAQVPTQHETPPGYFSLSGAPGPTACFPGEYNNEYAKSSCFTCESGYYCPNSGMSSMLPCPAGFYCPPQTSTPTPCPIGTFSNQDYIQDVTGCQQCLPGRYCSQANATAPTGVCAAGYFCKSGSNSSSPVALGNSNYGPCPSGHYCNISTGTPYKCPAGTYSPTSYNTDISACLSCPPGQYCDSMGLSAPSGACFAGYYCPGGSTTAAPSATICPRGYYCPSNSSTPQPCQAGTYMDSVGQSMCLDCPAGYYCTVNTSSPLAFPCPPGYFCPANTTYGTQFPCSSGYFNPSYGAQSASQCQSCTGGQYCPNNGMSAPVGNCSSGYYCSGGASTATPTSPAQGGGQCLAGYYCPNGTVLPVACPKGLYCGTAGLASPSGSCSAGYYCLAGASSPNIADAYTIVCPAGHYCLVGSSAATPCPSGTFNPSSGRVDNTACQSCTPGYYCAGTGLSAVTGQCAASYFCPGGNNVSTPVTNLCPIANNCPTGSSQPVNCSAGTYQDVAGASTCKNCPAGSYCLAAVSTPSPCPQGYYCPAGTSFATQYPCPAGTYNNLTSRAAQSDCAGCPAGYYCGTSGLSLPTAQCAAGFYCLGNATVNNPTSPPTGGQCSPGYICPAGSSGMQPCPGGKYCGASQLSVPSGDCSAGYYCSGGQSTPTPASALCPVGNYCPQGSSSYTACPAGTFSNSTGLLMQSDCSACTAGYYCNTSGLIAPTGACAAGYYCPAGQSVAAPPATPCPAGFYCPTGSPSPVVCQPGFYQPNTGQSTCLPCTAGYFCNGTNTQARWDCSLGHYCNGSNSLPTPCPSGTFGNLTNQVSVGNCQPCTPGYYCSLPGQVGAAGVCDAGYYCKSGANISKPVDGVTGDVCPPGYYCPENTDNPIPCPAGTWSNSSRTENASGCFPCPAGRYCQFQASVDFNNANNGSGPCNAGWVCTSGSPSPIPPAANGYICPTGHYCPQGSGLEVPCDPGTFNDQTGNSSCKTCLAGRVCPNSGMTSTNACPLGYYCTAGLATPIPCPTGTYGNGTSYSSVSQCVSCPLGYYCDVVAALYPIGKCSAGYMCGSGSNSSTPSGVYNPSGGVLNGACPTGNYCPSGTSAPVPCPLGTYQNETGASSCKPCDNGYYCASTGLTWPTGPCAPGYYCQIANNNGSTVPNPENSLWGNACPIGFYCPSGASSPRACPDGSYQDKNTSASCNNCPAGKYCREGVPRPYDCEPNYYCALNSSYPPTCPNGTYSNMANLTSVNECLGCPSGNYCVSGRVVGFCDAGYICRYNATNNHFEPCPSGSYCPAGVAQPISCPVGTFNPNLGADSLSDCTFCPEGYYCLTGVPTPLACPVGAYCPANSSAYTPCPIGFYRNSTLGVRESNCTLCPSGYYCNTPGIANYQDHPCPVGNFCPGGNNSVNCLGGYYRNDTGAHNGSDCLPCQPGYYCPKGSSQQVTCPPGKYCPLNTDYPIACPAGYYCHAGSATYTICQGGHYCPASTVDDVLVCPNGTYCPAGTASPYWCPIGTYSPASLTVADRAAQASACLPCPAGTYGDNSTRAYCHPCTPGYLCYGNTNTSTPTSAADNGAPCPKGYYCPAGSSSPIACASGTYNSRTKGFTVDNCTACDKNTFTDVPGQEACFLCGASSYSDVGATSCMCNGTNREFQRSDGSCICKPGFVFYDEQFTISGEDSVIPCQPIVYDRCASGQALSADGHCISNADCAAQCDGNGVLNVPLGTCVCDETENLKVVCDAACRASSPTVMISSDGKLRYVDENGSGSDLATEVDPELWTTFQGTVRCNSAACKAHSIVMSGSGGFKGFYQPTTGIDAGFSDLTTRRRLIGGNGLSISNPVLCVEVGETVLFDISEDKTHYPVYVKDSLLNTNPSFDYGEFRILAQLQASSSSATVFGFTFDTKGVYVFADNAAPTAQTIVGVQDSCTTVPIAAKTASAMSLVGASKNTNVMFAIDWALIGGLVGGFVLLIIGIIAGLAYVRHRSWARVKDKDGRKKKQKPDVFGSRNSNASAVTPVDDKGRPVSNNDNDGGEGEDGKKLEAGWDINSDEIDPRLFKAVYEKLTDHHKFVTNQFAKANEDSKRQGERILQEALDMKAILEAKLQALTGVAASSNIRASLMDGKPTVVTSPSGEQMVVMEQDGQMVMVPATAEEIQQILAGETGRTVPSVDAATLEKVENEKRKLDETLSKDEARQILSLRAKLDKDEEKVKSLNSKAAEQRQELLREDIMEDSRLSEEEKKQLLADYAKSMSHLENLLEDEKLKQEQELQARLREKAEKKKLNQQKRHEQEMIQQQVKEKQEQESRELERRQAEEQLRIQQEIDELAAKARAKLEEQKQRAVEEERQRFQEDLGRAASEEERNALLQKHEKDLARFEMSLSEEKDKQEDMLAKKLEKRRRDRERKLAQEHEQERAKKEQLHREELHKLEEAMVAPEDLISDTAPISEEISNPALRAAVNMVQNAVDSSTSARNEDLQREQERKRIELERKQAEEKEKMLKQMEAEKKAEEERIKQEMIAKQKADEAEKLRLQEQMATAQSVADEEERRRLVRDHESQLAALEVTLQSEKEKQEQIMKQKLAERQRKKLKDLQKQQEMELETQIIKDKEESAQLSSEVAKSKEEEALQKVVSEIPAEYVPEAITLVVRKRHESEISDLMSRQFTEKAMKLKSELQNLFDNKTEELRDLKVELEKELAKLGLLRDTGKITVPEHGVKTQQAQQGHVAKLAELEDQFAKKREEVEQRTRAEADRIQAQLLDALKWKHSTELKETLHKFVSPDVLKKMESAAAAAQQATAEAKMMIQRGVTKDFNVVEEEEWEEFETSNEDEIEKLRQALLKEREERLKKVADDAGSDEKKKSAELLKDKEEFEAALDEQRKREQQEAESRIDQQKQRLLGEKEDMQRRELEKMGEISEQMKAHILQQHKEDLLELEATMDAERARQLAKMKERLDKKKQVREAKETQKRDAEFKLWKDTLDTQVKNKSDEIIRDIEARLAALKVEKSIQRRKKPGTKRLVRSSTVAVTAVPTSPPAATSPVVVVPSTPKVAPITKGPSTTNVNVVSSTVSPAAATTPAPTKQVFFQNAVPVSMEAIEAFKNGTAPPAAVSASVVAGPSAATMASSAETGALLNKLNRVEQLLEGVTSSELTSLLEMFERLCTMIKQLRVELAEKKGVQPKSLEDLSGLLSEIRTGTRKV